MKNARWTGILVAAALAAGCGGGGGGGGETAPQPEPVTYPGSQVYANFVNQELNCNYITSGTAFGLAVSGSGTRSFGAAAAALFEGQVALSKLDTDLGTLIINGIPAPYTEQMTLYLTTNYQLLGVVEPDAYVVAVNAASPPASVKVGDTGPMGTLTVYQDATKATLLGRIEATYVVEADTDTTALFNFRTMHYDAAGTYLETDNWRLRMQTSGAVQLHSVAGADAAGNTVTFTCQ